MISVGDGPLTIEQLDSLPKGSVVSADARFPYVKLVLPHGEFTWRCPVKGLLRTSSDEVLEFTRHLGGVYLLRYAPEHPPVKKPHPIMRVLGAEGSRWKSFGMAADTATRRAAIKALTARPDR